jgi:hypothetical protein
VPEFAYFTPFRVESPARAQAVVIEDKGRTSQPFPFVGSARRQRGAADRDFQFGLDDCSLDRLLSRTPDRIGGRRQDLAAGRGTTTPDQEAAELFIGRPPSKLPVDLVVAHSVRPGQIW